MVATPQLDEIIRGVVVASDKLDDLKDDRAAGRNVGVAAILGGVMAIQADVLKAIDKSELAREELQAVMLDRESTGEVSKKIGLAVWDVISDWNDPSR